MEQMKNYLEKIKSNEKIKNILEKSKEKLYSTTEKVLTDIKENSEELKSNISKKEDFSYNIQKFDFNYFIEEISLLGFFVENIEINPNHIFNFNLIINKEKTEICTEKIEKERDLTKTYFEREEKFIEHFIHKNKIAFSNNKNINIKYRTKKIKITVIGNNINFLFIKDVY